MVTANTGTTIHTSVPNAGRVDAFPPKKCFIGMTVTAIGTAKILEHEFLRGS
jgi:hypothetical protein